VPNEYSAQTAAQGTTADSGPTTGVQLAGFRVITYSPSQSSIALAYNNADTPGSYGILTVAMQWYQGDWRVVIQPGPSGVVTSSMSSSLAGYVAWSGVS